MTDKSSLVRWRHAITTIAFVFDLGGKLNW